MADLLFQLVEGGFYIPSDSTMATARTGFLLANAGSNPPATIALADSLGMQGFYLFVPGLPQGAGLGAFLSTARSYLTDPVRAGSRFAWFPQPAATGGAFSGTTLRVRQQGAQYVTTESLFLNLTATILLRINGGNVITPDGQGGLRFTPPGGGANALHVTPRGGQPRLLPLATPLGLSLIGSGATDGCFGFDLPVSGSALADLDVGLRLFFRDAYWGTTSSYRYPVFSEESGGFTLKATVDPLAAREPSRSFFSFPEATGAIPTYYRTTLGHAVTLAPTGPATRLLFAARSAADGDCYLVPEGDFDVAVAAEGRNDAPTRQHRLMCGLSGVEYVIVAADDVGRTETRLSFTPGQPAFVEGFSPGQTAKGQFTLTGDMTTAWAYPHAISAVAGEPDALVYCAQPEDAVLHKHNHDVTLDGDPTSPAVVVANALIYMEVPSIYLPPLAMAVSDSTPLAFPMLPYVKVDGDEAAVAALERQVVSLARKRRIDEIAGKHPAPPPARLRKSLQADAPKAGATPQGLLANYSGDYSTLNQVLLARTERAGPGTEDALLQLQAIARGSNLWQALQSNQLFLVITDPAAVQGHLDGLIRIMGWQFHLDPKGWRKDTVLIFKFFTGKALQELAAAPDLWTMGPAFNANQVPHAAGVLGDAIAYAVRQCCGAQDTSGAGDCFASGACPGAPDFSNFIFKVLRNPEWNGILALNVAVPPTDLPDQLKVLAAGVDPAQFFAHHVGINASPVHHDPATGSLTMQPSSVFGLINYEDDSPLAAAVSYGFKVQTLKVLFQNSAIADFTSRVLLQVNALFEERVTLRGSKTNTLTFNGVYQEHDGQPSYVFSNQELNRFDTVAQQVLDSVTFVKAQFITMTQQSSGPMQSKFAFWGSMALKAVPGFDIFSFGADGEGEGGLSFANLAIVMSFDPAVPGEQHFSFDATHIAFDMASSRARSTSLFGHFPLKLTGFAGSAAGQLPADQGFMSVTSPLRQGMLSAPWYGLLFELQLGSLGALAEQSGFVATLIAAWSPNEGGGPEDYTAYVGLKLPGSTGGQREITLMGPLKIKMKNILFAAAPGKDESGQATVSYMLRFQTITVNVLSLGFPFSGRTDFLLFGDPHASGDNRTLGWYAVYDEGVKPKPKKPAPFPGLGRSGREG